MLNDTLPFKYKDLLLPENQNGFFNIAMKTQTFRHPEVRGHRVFELEVKGGCTNTLDLFSWSDRAWLVLCR